MEFAYKKAENCFSDAENYEYRIEVPGSEFIGLLDPLVGKLRINDKLRRPTFTAELKNGVQLKGLLQRNIIKVGFLQEQAAEQKASFEQWLSGI